MRALCILWLSLALPCGLVSAAKRPHILFILADDLGWNDVGWTKYPEIPTPNLNALKEEGLELTQFYVQPKCTPTRAALLTGRYPYKMGLQTDRVFSRVLNNTLDENMKTLPAYLKDLGYRSHMSGKWHLGNCNYNATPIGKGFETHFGPFHNLENRFNLTSEGGVYDWNWDNQPYWQAQGQYTAHLLSNHTQHILKEHFGSAKTKRKPIFMYLPFTVPHSPSTVPEQYITNTNCSRLPRKRDNEISKRRQFCGMVNAMDEGIGNITQTLKDLGVLEDFIIFFTSDNGCAPRYGGSCWPLRGRKQSVYEGGTRSRTVLWAPKYLKKGKKKGQYHGLIHVTDLLPTLLEAAGGNVSVLPKDIDGKGVWLNIKRNTSTSREWMVYNLDSSRKMAALRFKNATHDFKLVYSNGTRKEPGHKSPDPRPESERTDDGKKDFYKRGDEAYTLYNLKENPEEMPPVWKNGSDHAAKAYPAIFRRMKNRLKALFKDEVPRPNFAKMNGAHQVDGATVVGGC